MRLYLELYINFILLIKCPAEKKSHNERWAKNRTLTSIDAI